MHSFYQGLHFGLFYISTFIVVTSQTLSTDSSTIFTPSCASIRDKPYVNETCSYPDLYSPEKKQCLPFTEVDCHNRTEPITICDYPNSGCSWTKEPKRMCSCPGTSDLNFDTCRGLDDGQYPWHARKWSAYYIRCKRNRTFPASCDGSSVIFNFIEKKCQIIYTVVNEAYKLSLGTDIPISLLYMVYDSLRNLPEDSSLFYVIPESDTIKPTQLSALHSVHTDIDFAMNSIDNREPIVYYSAFSTILFDKYSDLNTASNIHHHKDVTDLLFSSEITFFETNIISHSLHKTTNSGNEVNSKNTDFLFSSSRQTRLYSSNKEKQNTIQIYKSINMSSSVYVSYLYTSNLSNLSVSVIQSNPIKSPLNTLTTNLGKLPTKITESPLSKSTHIHSYLTDKPGHSLKLTNAYFSYILINSTGTDFIKSIPLFSSLVEWSKTSLDESQKEVNTLSISKSKKYQDSSSTYTLPTSARLEHVFSVYNSTSLVKHDTPSIFVTTSSSMFISNISSQSPGKSSADSISKKAVKSTDVIDSFSTALSRTIVPNYSFTEKYMLHRSAVETITNSEIIISTGLRTIPSNYLIQSQTATNVSSNSETFLKPRSESSKTVIGTTLLSFATTDSKLFNNSASSMFINFKMSHTPQMFISTKDINTINQNSISFSTVANLKYFDTSSSINANSTVTYSKTKTPILQTTQSETKPKYPLSHRQSKFTANSIQSPSISKDETNGISSSDILKLEISELLSAELNILSTLSPSFLLTQTSPILNYTKSKIHLPPVLHVNSLSNVTKSKPLNNVYDSLLITDTSDFFGLNIDYNPVLPISKQSLSKSEDNDSSVSSSHSLSLNKVQGFLTISELGLSTKTMVPTLVTSYETVQQHTVDNLNIYQSSSKPTEPLSINQKFIVTYSTIPPISSTELLTSAIQPSSSINTSEIKPSPVRDTLNPSVIVHSLLTINGNRTSSHSSAITLRSSPVRDLAATIIKDFDSTRDFTEKSNPSMENTMHSLISYHIYTPKVEMNEISSTPKTTSMYRPTTNAAVSHSNADATSEKWDTLTIGLTAGFSALTFVLFTISVIGVIIIRRRKKGSVQKETFTAHL